MAKKEKNAAENNVKNNVENRVENVLREILENGKQVDPKEAYSTFDPEKEPKIMLGCSTLLTLGTHPGLVALAAAWNHRKLFAEVKAELTDEAASQGKPLDIYLSELRSEIEGYDAMQSAISQIKYAINYLKPREGKEKDTMVNVSINGELRTISARKLVALKTKFANDREALRASILENSNIQNVVEDF